VKQRGRARGAVAKKGASPVPEISSKSVVVKESLAAMGKEKGRSRGSLKKNQEIGGEGAKPSKKGEKKTPKRNPLNGLTVVRDGGPKGV